MKIFFLNLCLFLVFLKGCSSLNNKSDPISPRKPIQDKTIYKRVWMPSDTSPSDLKEATDTNYPKKESNFEQEEIWYSKNPKALLEPEINSYEFPPYQS